MSYEAYAAEHSISLWIHAGSNSQLLVYPCLYIPPSPGHGLSRPCLKLTPWSEALLLLQNAVSGVSLSCGLSLPSPIV